MVGAQTEQKLHVIVYMPLPGTGMSVYLIQNERLEPTVIAARRFCTLDQQLLKMLVRHLLDWSSKEWHDPESSHQI